MTADAPHKRGDSKPWSLTAPAFQKLLSSLGLDTHRAAYEYEELRRRIEKLFTWWGAELIALDLADRTLDRLARKFEEGAEVEAGKMSAYVRSVARMIFHESLREKDRENAAIRTSAIAPAQVSDEDAHRALDAGLNELSDEERKLVLSYYAGSSTDSPTIAARKQLATELGISQTALRIRAHRIRRRLEERLRSGETLSTFSS